MYKNIDLAYALAKAYIEKHYDGPKGGSSTMFSRDPYPDDYPRFCRVNGDFGQDHFKQQEFSKLVMSHRTGSLPDRLLKNIDQFRDRTFAERLSELIYQKGLKDSDLYNKAQVDRRLFSKIMSEDDYRPSKDTALALIIALNPTIKDAEDLLSRAGYALSTSSKRDLIIKFCIEQRGFDLMEVNEVLERLDQRIIGR